MELANAVNFILGGLTIIAQALALLFLFVFLFGKPPFIGEWISKHGVLVAFSAVLIATLGSLTYSDIIGYEPCKLCWFQRIFMYPQVLILGLAMFGTHRGSRALLDASFILSVIGAIISAYHYLLQIEVAPNLPCSAVGYSVSCAERFVMQFGYITIPLMAFSAFLLAAVSLWFVRKNDTGGTQPHLL